MLVWNGSELRAGTAAASVRAVLLSLLAEILPQLCDLAPGPAASKPGWSSCWGWSPNTPPACAHTSLGALHSSPTGTPASGSGCGPAPEWMDGWHRSKTLSAHTAHEGQQCTFQLPTDSLPGTTVGGFTPEKLVNASHQDFVLMSPEGQWLNIHQHPTGTPWAEVHLNWKNSCSPDISCHLAVSSKEMSPQRPHPSHIHAVRPSLGSCLFRDSGPGFCNQPFSSYSPLPVPYTHTH